MLNSIKAAKTKEELEVTLRHSYPEAYPVMLKWCGRKKELNALFDGTITPENYTWYIFIEQIPMIHKLRVEGKLTKGECTVNWKGYTYDYEGEMLNNLPHGNGSMRSRSGRKETENLDACYYDDLENRHTMKGMFLNGLPSGFCSGDAEWHYSDEWEGWNWEHGEWLAGKAYGK